MVQFAAAGAQQRDRVELRFTPLSVLADTATVEMPASHRSAAKEVDRPVRLRYCLGARYPAVLSGYPLGGEVKLRFVVDTLGVPEVEDMTVLEATTPVFIGPARDGVAKCRYEPAVKDGRPVRMLVQQKVVWHSTSKDLRFE